MRIAALNMTSRWRGRGASSNSLGESRKDDNDVHRRRMAGRLAAQRIDSFSRYFFPIIFCVFNVIYWMYYMYYKDDFAPHPTEAPPVV